MTEIGSRLKGFVIAVSIAAAAMYILMAIGSRSSRLPPIGNAVTSVPAGSDGRLNNGMTTVPVALDEDLVPELAKAAATRGNSSTSAVSGRLFFVTSDTAVRVSESSIRASRVRILTGSSKGRLGWVPNDWVKTVN